MVEAGLPACSGGVTSRPSVGCSLEFDPDETATVPASLAGVVAWLRQASHAELDAVLSNARLLAGWTAYDDEGQVVHDAYEDEDDKADPDAYVYQAFLCDYGDHQIGGVRDARKPGLAETWDAWVYLLPDGGPLDAQEAAVRHDLPSATSRDEAETRVTTLLIAHGYRWPVTADPPAAASVTP